MGGLPGDRHDFSYAGKQVVAFVKLKNAILERQTPLQLAVSEENVRHVQGVLVSSLFVIAKVVIITYMESIKRVLDEELGNRDHYDAYAEEHDAQVSAIYDRWLELMNGLSNPRYSRKLPNLYEQTMLSPPVTIFQYLENLSGETSSHIALIEDLETMLRAHCSHNIDGR